MVTLDDTTANDAFGTPAANGRWMESDLTLMLCFGAATIMVYGSWTLFRPTQPATVSTAQKGGIRQDELLLVFALATSMILLSGPIFGFSAIKDLLIEQSHAFEASCVAACTSESCTGKEIRHCQDGKLDTLAFLSFWAADASMVFFGELNDRFGPASAFSVGWVTTIVGFGMMGANAHESSIPADWAWYAACLCIGVGGPGIFMGCFAVMEKNHRIAKLLSGILAGMVSSFVVCLADMQIKVTSAWNPITSLMLQALCF